MNPNFSQRPKTGESEDEILAQEKAFLQSLGGRQRVIPAAKATRLQPLSQNVRDSPNNLPSSSKAKAAASPSPAEIHDDDGTNFRETKTNIDGHGRRRDDIPMETSQPGDPVMESEIVERVFDMSKLLAFNDFQTRNPVSIKPFTKAQIKAASSAKGQKPKSLFARSYEAKYGTGNRNRPATSNSNPSPGSSSSSTSEMNHGAEPERTEAVGDQIHPSLDGMTEEEILAEQQKLIAKMDPKLVEFIRSRKNKKQTTEATKTDEKRIADTRTPDRLSPRKTSTSCDKQEPMEADSDDDDAPVPHYDGLPINPKAVEKYPGMNKVELDKLAWTKMLDDPRPEAAPNPDGIIPRFNFQGLLLPGEAVDDPTTFEKGLHNHGEEMERPGYSLEELLTLSRSANTQQKAVALQTIGNIFLQAHTGIYDLAFDRSLFQLLDYMDMIYTIRKGMDGTDKTLTNMALNCLANLIFPLEEEVCLDIVYLWDYAKPHPWISTKSDNLSFLDGDTSEDEFKDEEILKLDLLEFLIHRSNLLERIQYLLANPSVLIENGVEGILKILIRVSRHSPNTLMKYPVLLKSIVEYYVCPLGTLDVDDDRPPNLQGVPQHLAFKIIRILIDSNTSSAAELYESFNILPVVLGILATEDWDSETSIKMPDQLLFECFRIWIAFLNKGFGIDEYMGFFPVLMRFVIQYTRSEHLTSFDLVHSGYLFCLLHAVLQMKEDTSGISEQDKHSHWSLVKDIVFGAEELVIKLLSVVNSPHLRGSFDEDSVYWAVAKALRFLVEAWQCSKNVTPRVISVIKTFLSSDHYNTLTAYLRTQSVVLGAPVQTSRYAENFSSVDAVQFGSKFHPVLKFGMKLPLLVSLCAVQRTTSSFRALDVINDNVKRYVQDIMKSTKRSSSADFFVRFELAYIYELANLFSQESPERFYLCYKAVSETPQCCSKLFNKFFMLALSSSCDEKDLDQCYKIYGGYLLDSVEISKNEDTATDDAQSKKVKFSDNTKLEDGPAISHMEFAKWSELSIDANWILEPLQKMHLIITNAPDVLVKNLAEIELQCKICVKMIEKCLKQHCDLIIQNSKDFVDVYMKICLIFLMGEPRIYFDEEISPSLVQILKILVNCNFSMQSKCLSFFAKPSKTEGIPNKFSDFYCSLVKEFEENSYFNEVFFAYLMVPLRIPEDSLIKYHFWTMGNLQYIKTRKENFPFSVNFLTSGLEKDAKILEIYLGLVRSGRINQQSNEWLFEVIRAILKNVFEKMNDNDSLSVLKNAFLKLQI